MFHDAKSRLFYELRIDVATAKGKGKQIPTCQVSSKNVDVHSRRSQAMAKPSRPFWDPCRISDDESPAVKLSAWLMLETLAGLSVIPM